MKIDSRESLVRDIADAMQNFTNEFDNRWFLNLTEQEVGIRVDPDYCDPDCLWPKDGDEVVEIDPVPSHEAFHAMEAFSDEQPRPIAEKLYRALSGSRPFARFKAAIEREQNHACMSSAEREQARPKGKAAADVLDLLQDWYDYKNKWYMEKAEEWMRENGVGFKDGKVVCTGSTLTWFEESEEEEDEESNFLG